MPEELQKGDYMGLVNVINSNGVSAIDILTAGKGSNQMYQQSNNSERGKKR